MESAESVLGGHLVGEISRLTKELEYVRAQLAALMKHVGDPALCKGCGAQILWVHHKDTGRHTPYNADGVNHFATCPQAANFKRKEK